MAFVTLIDLKNKVLRELDLEEDSLISADEFAGFVHDAVKDMVSELMKLGHEDRYYTSLAQINIVQGQSNYDLPSDIYGQKIYAAIYKRNTDIYPIRRMRGVRDYEKVVDANTYLTSSTVVYRYIFLNKSAALGTQVQLVPTPQTSVTSGIQLYYFREPLKAVGDSDLIDVPEEFIRFVETFVKVECLKKDVGNPSIVYHVQELNRVRGLMVETLTGQTLDQDTVLEQDMSFYQESV